MKSIIHSALSNSFDIFLGWVVIDWAYRMGKVYAKQAVKKYPIKVHKQVIFSCMLSIFISVAIAFLIFFIRQIDRIPDKSDYVYCLTGFFILVLPSLFAITKTFYKN